MTQIVRGLAVVTERPKKPEPQTASSGSYGGRKGRAPPHTPYKRRPYKVGDKASTLVGRGTIMKIRKNGHAAYLIKIPGSGTRWYSETEVW